jgi:transcriptional regulator with XRE-family HTH domain
MTAETELLAAFRATLDLSQEEMADALGIERSHLSRIEGGKRSCTPAIKRALASMIDRARTAVLNTRATPALPDEEAQAGIDAARAAWDDVSESPAAAPDEEAVERAREALRGRIGELLAMNLDADDEAVVTHTTVEEIIDVALKTLASIPSTEALREALEEVRAEIANVDPADLYEASELLEAIANRIDRSLRASPPIRTVSRPHVLENGFALPRNGMTEEGR